jgi:pSer/pThr/pTyr-binding forkhead associated (FHA) protein
MKADGVRRNGTTIVQRNGKKFKSAGLLVKKGVLIVVSDNFFGETSVIEKVETVIGRGRECDICLLDPLISKIHCKIIADDEGNFFIEDLGPKNPTHVNRKVLKKRRPLLYGDRVVMGETIVRFLLEEKLEKK